MLPASTRIGAMGLKVRDLAKETDFYAGRLDLQVSVDPSGRSADLFARDGERLLTLESDPAAPPRPRHTTGLYHFAILVPQRADLGVALATLIDSGYPLEGAADHLVSEAVYLADPEGNGIEIYCDRPRTDWPHANGTIAMATDPLDVEGVLAARGNRSGVHGLPRGARIGHVHLQVADVHQSEAFYCGVLGFELVTHYGASASFVSAGGYHHHIGMNTWAGQGAPPPPAGALGLMYASILVPTPDDLTAVRKRIDVAGVAVESRGTGLFVRDPSGNGLVLAVEAARAA